MTIGDVINVTEELHADLLTVTAAEDPEVVHTSIIAAVEGLLAVSGRLPARSSRSKSRVWKLTYLRSRSATVRVASEGKLGDASSAGAVSPLRTAGAVTVVFDIGDRRIRLRQAD